MGGSEAEGASFDGRSRASLAAADAGEGDAGVAVLACEARPEITPPPPAVASAGCRSCSRLDGGAAGSVPDDLVAGAGRGGGGDALSAVVEMLAPSATRYPATGRWHRRAGVLSPTASMRWRRLW